MPRLLLLLVLAISSAASAQVRVADRIVELCEGQFCYLRCSGTQSLSGSLTITGTLTAARFNNSATDGCYYGTTTTHGYCFATSSQSLVFKNNSTEQARISGVTGDFENYSTSRNVRTISLVGYATSGNRVLDPQTEGARVGFGPETNGEEQGTRIRLRQGIDGTAGSGTGITANQTSAIAHQVHKVTVINTALAAAATTDVTIWTTPVNTRLLRIVAEVTQVFTGGALSAMTLTCGNAAGGNQYLLSNSVFTAQNTWGDAAAEIGAGLLSATVADMGTSAAGIPGAIAISCRFTCTGANCSAATQGSVTFQIEHLVYP